MTIHAASCQLEVGFGGRIELFVGRGHAELIDAVLEVGPADGFWDGALASTTRAADAVPAVGRLAARKITGVSVFNLKGGHVAASDDSARF